MKVSAYVVRRLLKLPLMMLAVSIIVFGITRLGGSPIGIYINHEMTPAQVAEVAERYGLDDSLPEQYFAWLKGAVTGDLGWSGVAVAPVTEVLPDKLAASLELGFLAGVLMIIFGIGMGTYAGARRNTWADHWTRVFAISGASLPTFWFALLMLMLFYLVFPIAPLGRSDPNLLSQVTHITGFYSLDALLSGNGAAFVDALRHMWLPALILAFEGSATIARMMRSSLVEELQEDYVDTARAKGVPQRLIVRRHARRNALIPTVTVIGVSFGLLIRGQIVVELIFRWPGLGRWAADAVLRGDQATVMAFILVTSMIFLVVNLVVDVMYAYLDRRVVLGA